VRKLGRQSSLVEQTYGKREEKEIWKNQAAEDMGKGTGRKEMNTAQRGARSRTESEIGMGGDRQRGYKGREKGGEDEAN